MIIILPKRFNRRIIKKFTCLGKSNEKYLTFKVLIEKEVTRIDKNGEKIIKNISYIFWFIDSERFIECSLSIMLLKEFIELNVNTYMMIKNVKRLELNTSNATVFLNTQILKII